MPNSNKLPIIDFLEYHLNNSYTFQIPIGYYLIILVCFISILFFNALAKTNNLIFFLIFIELSLLLLGVGFCLISLEYANVSGFEMALYLLVIAAVEAVIGLFFLVILYKYWKTIDFKLGEEIKD